MRAVGWRADNGACGHYRIIWPFEAMAAAGHDAVHHTAMRGIDIVEADAAVVQRACLPQAVQALELVVQAGGEYWYEVDDDVFNLDADNVLFSDFNAPWRRTGFMHAMNMAKGLIVSTEPLAEALREYNDRAVVVPNCLPDYFADLAVPDEPRREAVRVVWAGSPTHHGDIHEAVRYGVRKAVGRSDDAELTVVGHDYRRDFGVRGGSFRKWSGSIPDFHASLPAYDIGLCPLRRTTFNRSKSGTKAMEYQAAGVVPIAQDCEAYRPVVTDGVDGFLVRTEHEWKDRLELLIHDHELRARMRAAALSLTPSRLVSANIGRLVDALSA
jgi:hypothetical protein